MERMRYLSGKEKCILTGVLWSAVIAGFVLGVLFPLYLRLSNFPETYKESQNRLNELEANIAGFNRIRSEFEGITTQIPRLRSLYLSPKNTADFIEAFEGLVKASGLYKEIQLVSEPVFAAGDKLARPAFVFQVTLVGSFEHLMQFLARLENFSYLVDVEKINIIPTKESQSYGGQALGDSLAFKPQAGDVAASITIRVYAAP